MGQRRLCWVLPWVLWLCCAALPPAAAKKSKMAARARVRPGGGWAAGELVLPEVPDCTGVERRAAGNLSAAEFEARYRGPGRPLLLEGATAGWGATQRWQKAGLLMRHGGASVKLQNGSDLVLAAGSWHFQRSPARTTLAALVASFGAPDPDPDANADQPFLFAARPDGGSHQTCASRQH
jgi:hypothetical protein